MKSTTALILVSVLATTPAIAGSSDGTKNWTANANNSQGSATGSTSFPAMPACKSIYDDETRCFITRDQIFSHSAGFPLTADELKAQQATNKAYNAQMVRRIIDAGGINADEQPVALASHPRAHYEAFGEGHQMGSNGGE
jgi:hypothetical protein